MRGHRRVKFSLRSEISCHMFVYQCLFNCFSMVTRLACSSCHHPAWPASLLSPPGLPVFLSPSLACQSSCHHPPGACQSSVTQPGLPLLPLSLACIFLSPSLACQSLVHQPHGLPVFLVTQPGLPVLLVTHLACQSFLSPSLSATSVCHPSWLGQSSCHPAWSARSFWSPQPWPGHRLLVNHAWPAVFLSPAWPASLLATQAWPASLLSLSGLHLSCHRLALQSFLLSPRWLASFFSPTWPPVFLSPSLACQSSCPPALPCQFFLSPPSWPAVFLSPALACQSSCTQQPGLQSLLFTQPGLPVFLSPPGCQSSCPPAWPG